MNVAIPTTIINKLKKPSTYLGIEINSVHKDIEKASVRFALVFPDFYEVGMSNQGINILYKILNHLDYVAAERVFVPGEDLALQLKEESLDLCSLESYYPVNRFDIVGFSLQYEMSYSSVLHLLSLAKIPFYAAQRDLSFPLIIGGGPSTYNPEPVADFFDLFLIGDGEEAIVELVETYKKIKDSIESKEALLQELAKINGVYVPQFFKPVYTGDGRIEKIGRLVSSCPQVNKRIYKSIEEVSHLISPIVPFSQTIHDRLTIEIDRGCTQGCRFCQAGYTYRPLRERKNDTIINLIQQALKTTGHEEVSLASLNSGRHRCLNDLISTLMRSFETERISLALPSLRPASLDEKSIKQIEKVRKTGFTIAPEAGTQRLRDIINKDITEDEIIETVEKIISGGWTGLKLYFMIGLPYEEREDVEGIYFLCKKIVRMIKEKKLRLKNINVSVSSFVPKPHTPFQRYPQNTPEILLEKQKILRNLFRAERKITLKMHNPSLSYIEAVFSRGDRRLSKVIEQAYFLGCRLDGWTEFFKFDRWVKALSDCNSSAVFYAHRLIPDSEILPWEHIKTGVSDRFLFKERDNAKQGIVIDDCRDGECRSCGVGCPPPDRHSPPIFVRYQVRFTKKGAMKHLSHLELSRTIYRACRRAAIPLAYSQGFHPHPKISFRLALPVGIESFSEEMIIALHVVTAPDRIKIALNRFLPEGIEILSVEQETGGNKKKDREKERRSKYLIVIEKRLLSLQQQYSKDDHSRLIEDFLEQKVIEIKKRNNKVVNIRPAIEQIVCAVTTGETIEINMILKEKDAITVYPYAVIEQLYQLDNASLLSVQKLE